MKFKISSVIIALAIYLPFESLILKYIPLPDTIYSYLRIMGVEVVIYLLFIIMLFNNMAKGYFLKRTILDIPILVFICFALFTMFYNNARIVESLIDIRSLLKYAVMYFIVANIDFQVSAVRKFVTAFVIIAFVQSIITAVQHFIGISDFWYPKASTLEIGAKSASNFKLLMTTWGGGREQGAGIGTFGDTVPLGNFMVIAITLLAALFVGYVRVNAYKMLFLVVTMGLVLFALFCTYSRGSVIVGFIGIPLVFIFTGKLSKLYPFAIGFGLVICVFVAYTAIAPKPTQAYYNPKYVYTDPVTNILEAFSSSYIEKDLDYSRGYVVSTLVPGFVKTIPLIGFGPDMETSLTNMCSAVLGENNFHAQNVMVIADVFWFAILSCYGIVGLSLFLAIIFFLFKGGWVVFKRSSSPEYRIIGLIMITLVLVNMPYMLIIRTLLFRPFAFYWWLLAGLVAGEYRRIRAAERLIMERKKTMKHHAESPQKQ